MRRSKHSTTGPYAPPTPSEVESEEGIPMAVARDLVTPHDAAMPTGAPLDQYDPEVARRWAAHGASGRGMTGTREENRAHEAPPPDYSDVDADGYIHPGRDDEPRH